MGCDIHSYVEIRTNGQWQWLRGLDPDAKYTWERDEAFPTRDYGLFGFLADVRNYSHSPVIAQPRGLPDDMSAELRPEHGDESDYHNASWLTLAELLAYNYDQVFWDRRVTKGGNGAALAEEGEGRHLTLREFLGAWYFHRLEALAELINPADLSDVRVVFWFDN